MADAAIGPADLVLDIGAGAGALTTHLVGAGARVLAVEQHPGRAARLRERFAGAPVTVIQADALTLYLPGRPFRVVASPPWSISTALQRLLLARDSCLHAAGLVLQGAAVRRYAISGERWLRRLDVRASRPLPRCAFQPSPKVDASVLRVRRR